MRKSIFEIENRLDIKLEYERLKSAFFEEDTIGYNGCLLSMYDFLEDYVFNSWRYRDTFTSQQEYLENLGISLYEETIAEEEFLYFLEYLLNIWNTARLIINFNSISFYSQKVKNIIDHNIPIILEKMNYTINKNIEIVTIIKRDADVDSVLEIVEENCAELLLEYNDIRNNTYESKKRILKELDLYIEEEKNIYKSYDKTLYDTIQIIVNKMGINHPINELPYMKFTKTELIEWYDRCFKCIIHILRCKNIVDINNQRKKLVENQVI